jgi:UDP-N-acetylmuramoyl-tripeptide--D-alanyl-D-alanine ligase
MKSFFKSVVVKLLSMEAAALLRRRRPYIIAITGSVGKTSTKDAIFTVLKDEHNVRKSEKSFNSELGVPLTVLGLQNGWNNPFLWLKNILDGFFTIIFPGDYPDILILEMGVDRPGDMASMCRWIKPDVVVLTRLPDIPVHVEYFDSPEAVVAEKLELVKALKQDGVLVYNNDDEQIVRVVEEVRQKAIGFSRYSLSDFTASADKVMYRDGVPDGFEFMLTHNKATKAIRIHGSLGVQHTYNFAAAVAVARVVGVSVEEAALALRSHESPAGRMRILPGLKETVIIDDTYNSSPVAAERALLTLKELYGHKRKIAVLGDMMELGDFSSEEHEKLGALVAKVAGVLVTVGVRSRKIAEGALEHGMDEANIFQYESAQRAADELQGMMRAGDFILVKGSQGVRLEKLVEEIMAEPEKAPSLLVRQSEEWKKR